MSSEDFGASLFKLNGVTCALSSNDDVLVNAVGCLDITVMSLNWFPADASAEPQYFPWRSVMMHSVCRPTDEINETHLFCLIDAGPNTRHRPRAATADGDDDDDADGNDGDDGAGLELRFVFPAGSGAEALAERAYEACSAAARANPDEEAAAAGDDLEEALADAMFDVVASDDDDDGEGGEGEGEGDDVYGDATAGTDAEKEGHCEHEGHQSKVRRTAQ